ncbi:hypothetical protein EYF80_050925 [Liparis tanakae]|uniref:Uncharacterized protein n=1 Tax=Liparis tanakae TaxID=230148 RepID=A0A4Z2FDR2_9TELE|nr:hypothetical protein EYF80_050925 [Liparis tanakae]
MASPWPSTASCPYSSGCRDHNNPRQHNNTTTCQHVNTSTRQHREGGEQNHRGCRSRADLILRLHRDVWAIRLCRPSTQPLTGLTVQRSHDPLAPEGLQRASRGPPEAR